jgi:hypothetical protein
MLESEDAFISSPDTTHDVHADISKIVFELATATAKAARAKVPVKYSPDER